MSRDFLLVISTCPDREQAEQIGATLVEEQLAACVNIIGGVSSIYRWQGEIQRDSEVVMFIKSHAARYASLESRLAELHPYELPEIIAVPLEAGLKGYLDWIDKSTTP